MFICNKCNKDFTVKQSYERHLNRKTPCVKPIFKCLICFEIFKKHQNLINHNNRKIKCQKPDLEHEIVELKHQLEIAKIHTSITNNNNITNNNIIINNFNNEEIFKITSGDILKILQNVNSNPLITKNANYQIDNFEYTNDDIKLIDTFTAFRKLIYNNNKFPQNRTLTYDLSVDQFYYYKDSIWKPFSIEHTDKLIKIIMNKIRDLINYRNVLIQDYMKDLYIYIGDNYDELNNNDDEDEISKYIQILKLGYKDVFDFHDFNEIS